MPKSIYVQLLLEQSNPNHHYLNRLVKILNHFISIEPEDKPIGYHEHHIIPRSWNPEWKEEPYNLLKIPAKAHYVIHHLMWKAFPINHSMMYAFERMVNCKRYSHKITAKIYSNLMRLFAERSRNYLIFFHQSNPNFVKRRKQSLLWVIWTNAPKR